MKIPKYLRARGINLNQFENETGVSRRTLQRIIDGEIACQVDNAYAIVLASNTRPARGRVVEFEDLIPPERKVKLDTRERAIRQRLRGGGR